MKLFLAVAIAVLAIISVRSIAGANKASALEQAVIVHFEYGSPDWNPFFKFEKGLETAVNSSDVGDFDGNELAVDGSDGTLYMYGPDADKLFAIAKPILLSTTLLKNTTVTIRYGDVKDTSARVVVIHLGS